MKYILLIITVIIFCVPGFSQDAEGSKDHPLFNRMEGYRIANFKEHEFDVYKDFRDEKGKKMTIEGRYYYYNYLLKKGMKVPSGPQVLRNYMNAVKNAGGTVIYEEGCCNVYLKLEKNNKVTWVRVMAYRDPGSYQVWIIEEEEMKQEIVVNSKAMLDNLNSQGHMAIYGIYFDSDKSEVKPESDPALEEISKLLSENPSLSLYVVGHTDNVGDLEYNRNLSRVRAEAVVDKLVSKYNISKERMAAEGVGPLAPVSTNDTDEGKALNRRVEIIKK